MKKENSNRIIVLGDYSGGGGTGKHDWTRAFSRKGILPTELAKQYKVTWCIVRKWQESELSKQRKKDGSSAESPE